MDCFVSKELWTPTRFTSKALAPNDVRRHMNSEQPPLGEVYLTAYYVRPLIHKFERWPTERYAKYAKQGVCHTALLYEGMKLC